MAWRARTPSSIEAEVLNGLPRLREGEAPPEPGFDAACHIVTTGLVSEEEVADVIAGHILGVRATSFLALGVRPNFKSLRPSSGLVIILVRGVRPNFKSLKT